MLKLGLEEKFYGSRLCNTILQVDRMASVPQGWVRLQFDVWADTYAEADKLMLAITNALNCTSFDYPDVRIAAIVSMSGGGQNFESGVKIQRKMRDFGVWFEYKN